jgi:hypothetical protein
MPAHLIQFATREDYNKGMIALADVPRTRLGLPDYKMLVFEEHIKALDQAGVPYEDLTKDASSGSTTPVQS